jgi:hypothetical protein
MPLDLSTNELETAAREQSGASDGKQRLLDLIAFESVLGERVDGRDGDQRVGRMTPRAACGLTTPSG